MRLKTKLLLAFLGSFALIMLALSALFLGQLMQQRVETAYGNNNVVAHQILYAVRHALEIGLRGEHIDVNNPEQLSEAVESALAKDDDLTATLNSVIRYSPAVYDVNIVDWKNRVLVSTDPTLGGQTLPPRPDFAGMQSAGLRTQIRGVFGRPRVYDVSVPLERNGSPFITVRVGVRSTFVRAEVLPSLRRAFLYSLVLIGAAFVLAIILSNIALRPLTVISARLDELEAGAAEDAPQERDEVAAVSGKIERLGRRMRSVEEVFTELKGNLDQILASLQDGLVLFTQDGRAVLVSDSAARFLGVNADEILGGNIMDVLDRKTVLGHMILDAFGAHVALLGEEVVTEEGRRVQVSLDFVHEESGHHSALGALLTLHDPETAQQLETELEMSRRLAGIGRLTAGVGHEVKNPINAIVVHMELLRNKLAGATPEAQRHLDVIQGEIQRLNRVVGMLVDFTRPVEVRLVEEDLRTVVEEVLTLTAAELATRNVVLERQFWPSPLPVHVDRDLLKQALLNIIQNAAQSMPDGGRVDVATRRDGRMARVSIKDSGAGIPPELLDKIFNLYFTTKPTGSGIGLAMTFRILQLHNGRVLVDSEVGVGTTFTLEIPLTPSDNRLAGKTVPQLALGNVNS